jgi:hypothetical protein
MKKVLFVGLLIATAGFAGCNTEEEAEEHNHVTITFDEPMNDEVIALASANDVHIHIDFVFEGEAHGYEVSLENEADGTSVASWDAHTHDANQTFTTEIDLSTFAGGTEFHLEAKGCTDHDCDQFESAEIHFSLGQ